MRLIDAGAAFLVKAMRRSAGMLATSAARHSATIGPAARFLASGSVLNIANRPERISVGTGSIIAGQLLLFRHGGMIRIGEWCYVGEGSRIWSASETSIGDRVLISHNVNVHDCDSHPLNAVARHRQFKAIAVSGHPAEGDDVESKPIVIEDDVWIGFNAIILKGSRVGARSVIAAGSVVTGTIAPDSLYIGMEVRRKLDADDRRK